MTVRDIAEGMREVVGTHWSVQPTIDIRFPDLPEDHPNQMAGFNVVDLASGKHFTVAVFMDDARGGDDGP